MNKTILVLPGDGVGPEITQEAIKVLKKIEAKYNHQFAFSDGLIGHAAIEHTGNPLPDETLDLCLKSDAILFGAIGHPKYDNDPNAKIRPEQGLLKLRKSLNLFANIRPILTFKSSSIKSPLKPEIIEGVDFVVIRELTGGIYFGEPRGRRDNTTTAFDTCVYTKDEIKRVADYAFKLAQSRKKKITLVDKANVLETSRLWRETVKEIAKNYPEIELEFMFVDNAAMQIIKRPTAFDVILTENMFGDILTDEASVITGSIGMLPSASIGYRKKSGADGRVGRDPGSAQVCTSTDGKENSDRIWGNNTIVGLYEPIHGSFPKAAGQNIANPIGTILSSAMLLEYSFDLKKEAENIREAVNKALDAGFGTKDIVAKNPLATSEMGDKIADMIS